MVERALCMCEFPLNLSRSKTQMNINKCFKLKHLQKELSF